VAVTGRSCEYKVHENTTFTLESISTTLATKVLPVMFVGAGIEPV